IALTAAYAAALGPDPEPRRDDQVQYLALARGLIERGEFTRAGAGEPFVPEPLRFPGYPLLLAAVCRTVGCERIVAVQAVLLALALARPFFLPLPLLLAALALGSRRRSARSLAPALLLAIAAFGAVLAPQVACSLTSFGRPLVGSLGTQLWLGYFQGLAPADLDDFQRAEADAGRAAIARLENAADRPTQAHAFVAPD